MKSKWKKLHNLKAFLVYKKVQKSGDKSRLCEELLEDENFKNYISLSSRKVSFSRPAVKQAAHCFE